MCIQILFTDGFRPLASLVHRGVEGEAVAVEGPSLVLEVEFVDVSRLDET